MIDVTRFQKEGRIVGDSIEDSILLNEMATEAKSYVSGFAWSGPIRALYLAFGVGGVLALFLVEFEHPIQEHDQFLWVVVGDLPSAYLVADIEDPRKVIVEYARLMESWALAVKKQGPLGSEFPVNSPPNIENADALINRIKFILEDIIPVM